MKKTFGCIALLISAAAMASPAMAAQGRNDTNYRNAPVQYNAVNRNDARYNSDRNNVRDEHAAFYVADRDHDRDHDRDRDRGQFRRVVVRDDCR
ncbi:MAG TPA: hypothetical protein VGH38_03810 [Bryobacteraceae bacterium]|jgi:hypothetical protein